MDSTFIRKVMMDIAVPQVTGGPLATGIEECRCPEGYRGSSCEECSRGYYRDRSDRCLQCQCNNNEESCSVDQYGSVLCECKPGYTGQYCDNTGRKRPSTVGLYRGCDMHVHWTDSQRKWILLNTSLVPGRIE